MLTEKLLGYLNAAELMSILPVTGLKLKSAKKASLWPGCTSYCGFCRSGF